MTLEVNVHEAEDVDVSRCRNNEMYKLDFISFHFSTLRSELRPWTVCIKVIAQICQILMLDLN